MDVETRRVDVAAVTKYMWGAMDYALPSQVEALDPNRLTLLYFLTAGLDLVGALDRCVDATRKAHIIDWVYNLQIVVPATASQDQAENAGFRGGPFYKHNEFDMGHLAMDYSALCVLKILGDDYGRIDRAGLLRAVRLRQGPDGSFSAHRGGESDMRFVFCAVAVCALLDDWAGMDKEKTLSYILHSQNYDGAFGQGPGQESHGGSTYCAVASLSLLGALDTLPGKDRLVQWLIARQLTGFQGRPSKDADTCYSWWIGSSLAMLGVAPLLDAELVAHFTAGCQDKRGGLSKHQGGGADLLHTYFGLAGLSALGAGNGALRELRPELGLTIRALDS